MVWGWSWTQQFQQGMQDLVDALPGFDFVFGSTPESGNVWIKDPPGGKGEPTTDPDWADLSISYLLNFHSQNYFFHIWSLLMFLFQISIFCKILI